MNLKVFFNECLDKEVFKKLSIYLVSSWVLLQVLAITAEPLGLPKTSVTILLLILILGFPINIFLVWRFHLLVLEKNSKTIDDSEADIKIYTYKKSSFKKMYFTFSLITSLLSIFIIIIIINNKFTSSEPKLVSTIVNDKIAILKFGNNTGDVKYDIIGKMVADWLIHGITENQIGQTVSPQVIEDYSKIINTNTYKTADYDIVKAYFKPGKLISGNYFLKDSTLLFQCSISDGEFNKVLISFKSISCDINDPLVCMESLKQLILGYLITEDKKNENLQEFPPKYEAYKYVLNAKANLDKRKLSLEYLNKAIEIDSSYFEPKVLRIANYYNTGQYHIADSLRRALIIPAYNNHRQQNLLNLYQALLEGNNKKIYKSILYEYNFAPYDLESNESTMAVAIQFVNKPIDVDSIFQKIPMDKMDLENCTYCKYRIYLKSIANIELKKYKEVENLLANITVSSENSYLFHTLIAAKIRLGNFNDLKKTLESFKLKMDKDAWLAIYFFAANQLLLSNEEVLANIYFREFIKNSEQNSAGIDLAKSLFYVGDFKKAESVLNQLLKESTYHIENLTWLAMSQYKNNKLQESTNTISKLNALRANYQFGELDYNLARFDAITNNEVMLFEHLTKSVASGYKYTLSTFQYDPIFKSYIDTEKFKALLNYWH